MNSFKCLMLAAGAVALITAAPASGAEEQQAAPQPDWMRSMTQTMNPVVYMNMMQMMFNPEQLMKNPMAMCAQCHTPDDMARYDKTMGPTLKMMHPGLWMNPNAYWAMMTPAIDPNSYLLWYNAWLKKYGTPFVVPAPAQPPAAANK